MTTLVDEIRELGPWFHNLRLPDGTQTAPEHPLGDYPAFKWAELASALPERLDGWTALDIGCNAGFYSLRLAERGAEVVGIDHDPRYLRQAEWAAERFGMSERVRYLRMSVYDLARVGRSYDLVLFMGVFYHLRYPVLGLDIAARLAKRRLVFQSMTAPGTEVVDPPPDLSLEERGRLLELGWPKLHFVEKRVMGDPTNWWVPNHAAALALLRASGLRVLERPLHETYVCEPDPDAEARDEEQYRAALGLA